LTPARRSRSEIEADTTITAEELRFLWREYQREDEKTRFAEIDACEAHLRDLQKATGETMLNEAQDRAAVVAEARAWCGTPYHHLGDVKGAGVDCAMLIVRVYCDLGLVPPFDPRPYPPDWHLHRSEERYLGFVFERARRVAEPREGDVMVMRYGRAFAHGGIVTRLDPLTIVHAFQPYRRVLEEAVHSNPEIARRGPAAVFASYW
jgi:cell wall-associated NlpC family hydrolase